jgi:diguanylate cyclase (GGDEF)-like protein/PAS domain S-box-containing protein
MNGGGGIMKSSSIATAGRRLRARLLPDFAEYAPLRGLVLSGLVLMTAIAIGTALTISKFRESAIETGKQELESAVLLLARHFDQQLDDFAVLQKEIVTDLQAQGVSQPDIFKSEMGTLAIHEMLRKKAGGWPDLAGVNLFDSKGVLINSSQRWPVADIAISDRAYFRTLIDDVTRSQTVDVVASRFASGHSIVFARRVLGPRGEFLGVVTRAIRPEAMESFFASVGLGPEATIAMHQKEGLLLARYPHVEAMIGENFKKGPSEQRAVFEAAQFTGQLRSPMDSRQRLVASRMLNTVPLVIVATKTFDATLASWRLQTRFFISMATLSVLVTVMILYLIFRQMMRQHRFSQRQIAVEKQRLDTAISHMSQGLLLFDSSERLIICNRRYIEMYGLSREVVRPGCTFRDLLRHRQATGSFQGDVERYCDDVLRNNGNSATMVVDTADGRLIQIKNEPVPGGGWLATHEDVTERVRAEERITHLAHYDALTDLPNRVSFREHVEHRLSRGVLEEDRFAILYIDVDEFKSINDSLGHHVGDELLKCIASRLSESADPGDLVARLGGDEFAIVKAQFGEQANLVTFVENLYRAVRSPITCCGHEVTTDASIGIALAPDDGISLDQLVKNADLAMYDAKLSGRRTFRFFAAEMGARMQARRALELDLRQAISAREFEVYYQPLVDLASDAVTGCEALLRWNHRERGFVSPAEFIPVAEETGLITELGDWVLEKACADAMSWPDHVMLAVNVSPVQFKSKTLALKVASALARSGLSARRLELEITEAVLIRDDEEALTTLLQLRELGVRISLDDFGTGYSSLSYLQRFPFDKIKIDRSFVSDVCEAGGSSPIVRALVAMALARSMSTTAEGVETEAQREMLRELGCTQMQGFLFSPAVPTKRLQELFAQRTSGVSHVA